MSISYVEDYFTQIESKPSPCRPYGQGADGSGLKIAMPYLIRLNDRGPWRRVYCTCISNNGSIWIVVNGKTYHFRNDENVRIIGKWVCK